MCNDVGIRSIFKPSDNLSKDITNYYKQNLSYLKENEKLYLAAKKLKNIINAEEIMLAWHRRYLNDRKLVVWGTGYESADVVEIITRNNLDISFFVSADYEKLPLYFDKSVKSKSILNREKHYVICASSRYYQEINHELISLGFELETDYFLWHLPLKPLL